MASKLDLYNMALANVGISTEIGSLAEPSNARRVCDRYYQLACDEVLSDFPWRFNRQIPALSLLTESTPGWAYTYQYPANCLGVRAVCDASGIRSISSPYDSLYQDRSNQAPWRVPFDIGLSQDGSQKTILTDLAGAYGIIGVRIGVIDIYPADVLYLVSVKLSFHIAIPLLVKPEIAAGMDKLYTSKLSDAGAAAMNEALPDKPADSPSILVR